MNTSPKLVPILVVAVLGIASLTEVTASLTGVILSVLSMTPQERAEMTADPRGRDILERCSALTPEDLMALHGTIRSMRPLEDV